MIKEIVFLLKAGELNGLGHLSRCLSLAETLDSMGYISTLKVVSDGDDRALSYIQKKAYINYYIYSSITSLIEGISSNDLSKNIVYVKDYYGVDHEIELLFKKHQVRWAEFDYKFDRELYSADFIINGNPGVFKENYSKKLKTNSKLLIGLKYSIISNEIFDLKKDRAPLNRNILVSLGGGEMPKHVVAFISSVVKFQDYTFHIQTNDQNLSSLFKTSQNVSLIKDKENLVNSYIVCKYGIVAGGVTSHEMAYLGIKMLFYPFSENHLKNVENWSKIDFGIKYSDDVDFSECIHKLDRLKPYEELDGKGRSRIAKALVN